MARQSQWLRVVASAPGCVLRRLRLDLLCLFALCKTCLTGQSGRRPFFPFLETQSFTSRSVGKDADWEFSSRCHRSISPEVNKAFPLGVVLLNLLQSNAASFSSVPLAFPATLIEPPQTNPDAEIMKSLHDECVCVCYSSRPCSDTT